MNPAAQRGWLALRFDHQFDEADQHVNSGLEWRALSLDQRDGAFGGVKNNA